MAALGLLAAWTADISLVLPHSKRSSLLWRVHTSMPLRTRPACAADSAGLAQVGLVAWQCGFLLADYLLRRPPFRQWQDVRLLDLGAGTGEMSASQRAWDSSRGGWHVHSRAPGALEPRPPGGCPAGAMLCWTACRGR